MTDGFGTDGSGADASGRPEAGWYDDPYSPGRMRYFDGDLWTNHYHSPGSLPDLGTWLSSTFTVFANHWQGAAIIALVSTLLVNSIVWVSLTRAFDSVAVVDEDFVNFGGSLVAVFVIAVFLSFVCQAIGWLALNRYMQRAHYNAEPSIGEALERAIRRLPRLLLVLLTAAVVVTIGMLIVVVITVAVPALGVLLILAAIPLFVWLYVKFSFVIAAIAAAPQDAPVWASSAGVSSGRFWGVFGRLLLVTITIAVVSNMIIAATGGLGSPVDQEVMTDILISSDGTIRDFSFSELLPSGAGLATVILINSVVGAVTAMITTSAFMRLYLDSGAPSEL